MAHPWFAHYNDGVPHAIDTAEYANILAVLEEAVAKFRDKTAFVNHIGSMEFTLTYGELDQHATAFAAYLQNFTGLHPGDRIAIQLPNLLQYPIAVLGALKAGLVVVNTNPLYTASEMQHQFVDSGARGLVILNMFAHKLPEFINTTQLEQVIVADFGDLLPFPKRALINFVARHVSPSYPGHELEFNSKTIRFRAALQAGAKSTYAPVTLTHDDIAFLQYTGGTTGVSKGAILTHKNVIANMQQIAALLEPVLDEGQEEVLTPLPLYHIFALTVNMLAFLKSGGKNVLVTNPRDLPGFIQIMKKSNPTVMTGVNTLFNALLNHPDFATVKMPRLKFSVGGAMALQQSVVERWEQTVGSPLVEGYGLTEASPVVSVNPFAGGARTGTIGLPVPSTDVKLLEEDGTEIPYTEFEKPGEITVSGPQVMQGYWNRPEESENTVKNGWLRTGDIAVWQEGGFLKIVDRKKDMILVSGFNVYPNEVEDVIAKHPAVLEVACIGVHSEKSGEEVKIIVVPKGHVTPEELLNFSREHLTGYKVPKHVEIRSEELPKSNVGKILRRVLREEEDAKHHVAAAQH